MIIKLFNGHVRTNEEIAVVEEKLGKRFPDSYRMFVAKHDGAVPELNEVETEEVGFIIQVFIPIDQLTIEEISCEEDLGVFVAIALDGCGNKVLLDLQSGEVRFQDHELHDSKAVSWKSFESFLAQIRPIDLHSTPKSSIQVVSTWIDPKFKDGLKGS